jgi:hypothetical protein
MISQASTAATFAALFATLYTAHQVADHWIQTQPQADHKGDAGWQGWAANLGHVASYTAVAVLGVLAVVWRLGLDVDPVRIALGLGFSAISHSWADRRHTLRWLADRTGSGRFYRLGTPRADRDDNPSLGTGAYALDQSFHVGCLFIAALIAV